VARNTAEPKSVDRMCICFIWCVNYRHRRPIKIHPFFGCDGRACLPAKAAVFMGLLHASAYKSALGPFSLYMWIQVINRNPRRDCCLYIWLLLFDAGGPSRQNKTCRPPAIFIIVHGRLSSSITDMFHVTLEQISSQSYERPLFRDKRNNIRQQREPKLTTGLSQLQSPRSDSIGNDQSRRRWGAHWLMRSWIR
jgi:hypothetical protein